ncbi:MAG: hypothetical protein LBV54_01160 [Puniceicoccales bacterium]|jgi:hypothetical protein|nr:hypothetical protein [Puniceicoccales bacterium]
MFRQLRFTTLAKEQLEALRGNARFASLYKQICKALGYLEVNPAHPGLSTHKFFSLRGVNGEEVFEAYAQNNTPGAYRIFWHYGPDESTGQQRISIITIIAITPHP